MHPLKFLTAALCLFGCVAQAHEFWIEPQAYQIEPGDTALATFHVGQEFKGPNFLYIPGRTNLFEQVAGGQRSPVQATVGDNPAFQLSDAPEGLLIVAHETSDSTLLYREFAKFEKFVAHKDFKGLPEAHIARGLPQEGFRERYRRFAKALIGVGNAAGQDVEIGMRTEIVAMANPYVDDVTKGMPVKVLFEQAPRADAQVELFEKAPDGTVSVTLHRTDDTGVAVLPVQTGHSYLVDAVVLLPLQPETENDPVWYSLWAALTFAVP